MPRKTPRQRNVTPSQIREVKQNIQEFRREYPQVISTDILTIIFGTSSFPAPTGSNRPYIISDGTKLLGSATCFDISDLFFYCTAAFPFFTAAVTVPNATLATHAINKGQLNAQRLDEHTNDCLISNPPATGDILTWSIKWTNTPRANIPVSDFGGTLAIAHGGTGATNATNAINALLPTQVLQSGKFLTTNGANVSWAAVALALSGLSDVTITSIADKQTLSYESSSGKWKNNSILAVDRANNRVGVNNTSPSVALDITGALKVSSTGEFTGQVTVPASPSASTDAASKGYVDTAVASVQSRNFGIYNTAGGRWYCDPFGRSGTTVTWNANSFVAVPFIVWKTQKFYRMNFVHNNTGATGNLKFFVWDVLANAQVAGTYKVMAVPLGSTLTRLDDSESEFSASGITLAAGLYLLCACPDINIESTEVHAIPVHLNVGLGSGDATPTLNQYELVGYLDTGASYASISSSSSPPSGNVFANNSISSSNFLPRLLMRPHT